MNIATQNYSYKIEKSTEIHCPLPHTPPPPFEGVPVVCHSIDHLHPLLSLLDLYSNMDHLPTPYCRHVVAGGYTSLFLLLPLCKNQYGVILSASSNIQTGGGGYQKRLKTQMIKDSDEILHPMIMW